VKLVLLTIDALQPAYLGPYGNEWFDTPVFDALAAKGVVFDQHFAASPGADLSFDTEALQTAGVAIARAERGVGPALKKIASARNALLLIDDTTLLPPWKKLTAKAWHEFIAGASDAEEPPKPWFEPLPFTIDRDDDALFEQIQLTYAAAVARLDSRLGELADELEERGWGDAIWIITSPRGLPLGEHGVAGYPGPLHEELVHLPLIMVWPDGQHAGRRVSALTQPADIAATVADFFGVAPTIGSSLMPLLHSPHAKLREHIVITDGRSIGVRTPEWYWLRTGPDEAEQLFVKPDDRWEMLDVGKQHMDVCDELRALADRSDKATKAT
jgi:arylsulfatase A-like enzyme